MKKETFVSIINAIDEQYANHKKNEKLLETVFPDSTIIVIGDSYNGYGKAKGDENH